MNTKHIGNLLRAGLKKSALAIVLALLATPSAKGQLIMALTGDSSAQGYSDWGSELDGFRFRTQAGKPITVKWLGYYDQGGDGLASEHLVRIWKVSGDPWPVVASATIPAGLDDPLVGSFRGHDITPVELEPDTEYVIASSCNGDSLREGNDLAGWGINGITILGGQYGYEPDPPTDGWDIMISASFGYTQPLTVTLNTPAANQGYPTGSSIIASATVIEPNIALTDTVTFHMTPTSPPGSTVQLVSADTTSPYTANFGVLPAGTYEMYAAVANNDAPPGTDTSATHTFTVAPLTTTTTTVSSSGTPSTYGSCTLTATISPTPAGGTVQFYDGLNYLGAPVAVNPGTGEAQYNANLLGAGIREITAEYSGFGIHGASTTATAFTQTVDKAPLTVKALNTLRAPNTANPDPFPYQITGFQNEENLAASGVTGTPDLTTTAIPSSPAAEYPVTCALGTLAADNYSFSFVDAILTVAEVANTFSVNFVSYGGLNSAEEEENVRVPAGVPAGIPGTWYTSGWSNFEVPWAPGSPLDPVTLTSNEGSTATFTFKDCRNGWTYSGGPRTTLLGDGNGNMMDGHVNSTLDPGDGSNLFDMEVTGIPFAQYDVIFYIGANEAQFGEGNGRIVFNGVERGFKVIPGAFEGTFTEMTDDTTPGNYIVFSGVTGASFTTKTWGTDTIGEQPGFNHVGPYGFQIREAAAPGNTFTAWANANNASNQSPSQDHDNDGVENGVEYFMGQTGSSFTSMPGLDGTNTVAWTMDPDYQGTYEVQTSPDLGTWTNVDPKPLPSGGTLSHTLPPGAPGGKSFVRLLVRPAP